MFTDEGKFLIAIILFLISIFACGYFMGWSRDKLSEKIFDKMLYSMDKVSYWKGRYEGVSHDYANLLELYVNLKAYTLEKVGVALVPTEFGGEFEEESE